MPSLSLANANILNLVSNFAAIIGGVLAVLGAAGLFVSGSIRDQFADSRARELENATAVAKADAARAQADAAKANESNTRLKVELEREQAERLRLEKKVAPRSLTADQKARLVAAFKSTGWHTAEVIWHGQGEPEHYAREFAAAFEEAGISTKVHTLGPFIPSADGLMVVNTKNGVAARLHSIMEQAGLVSLIANTNETMGEKDHPTLMVGSRKN